MKKHELKKKTDTVVAEIKAALQTVYDALNQGQRKKIIKDEQVKPYLIDMALYTRSDVNGWTNISRMEWHCADNHF